MSKLHKHSIEALWIDIPASGSCLNCINPCNHIAIIHNTAYKLFKDQPWMFSPKIWAQNPKHFAQSGSRPT